VICHQVSDLKEQMTELERVRAQTLGKYREIESRSDLSLDDQDALDRQLKELRKHLMAVEAKMQTYASKIKNIAKKTAKIDLQIAGPAALKKALADEKKNLIRWACHTFGKPRVIVDGEIVSGTVIQGLHSTFVPEADYRHVRIMERPFKSDDAQSSKIIYQMKVDDL
jgi:seryl-tRNA synthetase